MSEAKRYVTFEEVKEKWESNEDWQFADRDAERRYFFDAATSALTARIASLEREKEESRNKALDDAAHLAEQSGQTLGSIVAAEIRAMKGAKP